jgi:hypothetical protein
MQRTAVQSCASQAFPRLAHIQHAQHTRLTAAASPLAARLHSRRSTVTCVARRTKSGGGERDRKSPSPTSTKSSSSNSSQITGTRPSKSSSSSSNNSSRPSVAPGGKQQGISELETFIRNTPVANRFLDGILILGDAVMLLATEMSSERLPLEQVGFAIVATLHLGVATSAVSGCLCWCCDWISHHG